MSLPVVIGRRALADMEEIYDYIAADSVAAANRLAAAFADQFDLLGRYPRIGASRDDLGAGQRHIVVDPYLILYGVSRARVEIIRVVHGRRDLAGL